MSQNILNELEQIVNEGNILVNEPMNKHTTFRIGGPADYLVMPTTIEQIAEVIRLCRQQGIPYFVMGNGSNLLVSDAGFRGVIVQIYDRYRHVVWNGTRAVVEAGCLLSKFGSEAALRGLTGDRKSVV